MPVLADGSTFDRYRIEGALGNGGMGRVYRAYDPRLRRQVALKLLLDDSVDEGGAPKAELVARMMREARSAAPLIHPNIVAIFDVGEVDGLPYIAMEFIEGQPLRHYVGDASVPTARKVRWLADVARGLAAAHSAGVIHRDVKPANIIVGDDDVAKLVDFGVAKLTSSEAGVSSSFRTLGGAIIGTPRYMAPEQILGDDVDARCDQYAWAVVAHELLVGARPAPLPNVANLVADLPPGVAALITRALATSARDRFASMDEIVAVLDEVVPRGATPAVSPGRRLTGSEDTTRADSGMSPKGSPLPSGNSARPPKRPLMRSYVAWLVVAAVAVGAGVGGLAAAKRRALHPGPSDHAIDPATTPAPSPSSAEALAAYTEGLQASRDGDMDSALAAFQRATERDPMLGAAYLRLAIILVEASPSRGREAFVHARQLRATLSERDQGLLDAYEANALRDPPDPAQWARQLSALGAKYPSDPEIACYESFALLSEGEVGASEEAIDRALAVDPHFAQALFMQGQDQAYLGDFDASLRSAQACLEVVRGSANCFNLATDVLTIEGRCEEVDTLSRSWIAASPSSTGGYTRLANAQIAEGAPWVAVGETLARELPLRSAGFQHRLRLRNEARLAILSGDFVSARRLAKEWLDAARDRPDLRIRAEPAIALLQILEETGERAQAAELAADYLARAAGLAPDPRVDDVEIGLDVTPQMLDAERRAGVLTRDAFELALGRWESDWRRRTAPFFARYLWIVGSSGLVDSPEDAHAALAHLGDQAPPPFRLWLPADGRLGWTYFLGGRKGEGVAVLRQEVAECTAFQDPYEHTRASFYLAQALEQQGDIPGACSAYDVVLARWGRAKPRSLTGQAARSHATALGCRALAGR